MKSATCIILLLFAITSSADQQAVCKMDDDKHSAEYQCPDGFEISIAGAGTTQCTGACYKQGSASSFSDAVKFHAKARNAQVLMDSRNYDRAISSAMQGNIATINTSRGPLTICAPQKGKCGDDKLEWWRRRLQ